MAKDKKSAKETAAIFGAMAKAMVSGNPKPNAKAKAKKLFVIEPQYLSQNVLFGYGFEKIKANTYLLDGIEIKREGKDKFYHIDDEICKTYLATVPDLQQIFTNYGKAQLELVYPSGF